MKVHESRSQQIRRCIVVAGIALSLVACTVVHTPSPALPSRNSLTAGETVTVQGNQNIYAFAHAHNASMREIIVLNDLRPPFILKPGQKLVLPSNATVVSGDIKGQAPAPQSSPSGSIEKTELAPLAPTSVQVIPLDQPSEQKKTNNAAVLVAPVSGGAVEALNAPTPPPKPIATTVKPAAALEVATGSTESITPTADVPPPPVLPAPMKQPVASVAPAPVAPSVATLNMKWPLQGPILSSFGDKGVGLTNDGINIGAPKGAPVVAAAGGTVVYVGNEMKGFGNLILIRHEKGWVSAYAHLDRTLVAKDSVVAQGDMIGTVGKTGNVPSPQLHFETRHDGKPVDPRSLIKG